MRVTLAPSSVTTSGLGGYQYLTSFLINESVAIDAGSLGYFLSPQDQARIKHVFISHSHIDHIGGLPIFLENAFEARPDSVIVHGTRPVLDCIQQDLLNDRVWPDFVRLSTPKAPFVRLSELTPFVPVEVEGLRITPIPVHHVVPTCGFIIEDGTVSVVMPADTAATEAIWEHANRTPNVKGVFLEVTFPDEMAWLANAAMHHTPKTFALELAKFHQKAAIHAVHIKPRYRAKVVAELQALGLDHLSIGEPGHPYLF